MSKGLKWDTLWEGFNGYKVIYAFLSCIIWAVIFFLLGVYIEQVYPKKFGL